MNALNRRSFLRSLGISAAALPFVAGLPSLAVGHFRAEAAARVHFLPKRNGAIQLLAR
jgi:hypothetical protein